MFGDKLSQLSSFQSHYQANIGETREEYAERIKKKLSDNFYVKEWDRYLKEVGFNKKLN